MFDIIIRRKLFWSRMLLTWAGARVQLGILFSSVSMEKRSSADAMKLASMLIVAVLTDLVGFFTAGCEDDFVAEVVVDEVEVCVAGAGAGVPLRLGSALTVRSLP
jgi:hypothetical protein